MADINKSIEKNRSSNFELLRIFAMLGIILCHCCTHGFVYNEETAFSFNLALARGMTVLGICGNYIFMLISGFFLCTSRFTWKKFLNIWSQMFFWSALFTLAKVFLEVHSGETIVIKDFLGFLPLLSNSSWYASSYLIFYLFLPFLNKTTDSLERTEHLKLTVLLLVFGSVVSCLFFQKAFNPGNIYNFIMMYFTASYIRKYEPDFLKHGKRNLIAGILLVAFYFLANLFIYFVAKGLSWQIKLNLSLTTMMIFAPAAILIFSAFNELNIGSIKAVNFISSLTFGIYLIHDNSKLRPILWNKIVQPERFQDRKEMILIFIAITIAIFIICGILESCRMLAFHIVKKIHKTGNE